MKDVRLNNSKKLVSTVDLNNQRQPVGMQPIGPMTTKTNQPVEFGNTARDVILYKKVNELAIAVENKQDKFDFIEFTEPSGILDQELVEKLISNKCIELEFRGEYYSLGISNLETLTYIGPSTDPMYLKKITVDKLTGEYLVSSTPTTFANHVNDNERHINEGERDFWNNKLNCETDGEELILNRN